MPTAEVPGWLAVEAPAVQPVADLFGGAAEPYTDTPAPRPGVEKEAGDAVPEPPYGVLDDAYSVFNPPIPDTTAETAEFAPAAYEEMPVTSILPPPDDGDMMDKFNEALDLAFAPEIGLKDEVEAAAAGPPLFEGGFLTGSFPSPLPDGYRLDFPVSAPEETPTDKSLLVLDSSGDLVEVSQDALESAATPEIDPSQAFEDIYGVPPVLSFPASGGEDSDYALYPAGAEAAYSDAIAVDEPAAEAGIDDVMRIVHESEYDTPPINVMDIAEEVFAGDTPAPRSLFAEPDAAPDALQDIFGNLGPEVKAEEVPNEVERIANRMQAGLIVSETAPAYSENNLLPFSEQSYMAFDNLTSVYNMKFQDGNARPLYEELSFSIPRGSCTAFVSNMPLDVHALLRATKNSAGIKDGRIVVVGENSADCPNLLYIENDSMINYGIPALQFLMICLSEVKMRPAAKQEKLYQVLEEVSLSHIALTDTKLLTKFQRFALLLITVAMSNLIDGVVLNPNRLSIDMSDEYVVRKVFALLHKTGKTVLLAGNNMVLTECVANRIVALRDGKLVFDGLYKDFIELFCESGFSFSLDDTEFAMKLREDYPNARYEKRNDFFVVSCKGDNTEYITDILTEVLDYGINPRGIAARKKSYANAVERMVKP